MEEAFKGRDAHYEIRKLLNSYIRDLKDDFSESLLVNENLFSVLVNPIEQFNGAYIAKDFALSTDNFRASLQVLQRTVVKNKVLVVSMLDEMERFSQRAEPIFFLYDEMIPGLIHESKREEDYSLYFRDIYLIYRNFIRPLERAKLIKKK